MNRIIGIVLSIAMVFLAQSLYFGNQVVAASSNANDDCPIFSIKYGCDLSAWSHLIIDGAIAAFLGVFFHHLAHKQSLKLKKIVEEHDCHEKKEKRICNSALKNQLYFVTVFNVVGK